MQYRILGKTNEKVSTLGFGCMRFKIIDNKHNQIDEDISIKQIRYAIDNGVNYIDTAYPYHGGESERLVGKALQDGYREKVKLATKLPSWLVNSREDMDKLLEEQLEKLQTDYVDFYLLHALKSRYWKQLKENDIFDFMKKAVKNGKVKHVGFSFHDDLDLFKEIVDAYDWDFCQIQYNYLDENYQAGKEGLKYAKDKGLGIVIMEPLRGGSLTNDISNDIQQVWNRADIKRTPAEWALKFLLDQEEVDVILSGMNEMEHIKENIKVATETTPNSLAKKEKDLIEEVKEIYNSKMKVKCTSCGYCMPCPVGVNIPECFTHYNHSFMFGYEKSKTKYNIHVKPESRASKCVQCGKCESQCPQNIKIRERLKDVAKEFEE
jgi:predicted aldo/keto reductase-like oxidoreductase